MWHRSLHGIRRDLQQSLVRDGWKMRVYVPFGTEWYPYFMFVIAPIPVKKSNWKCQSCGAEWVEQ